MAKAPLTKAHTRLNPEFPKLIELTNEFLLGDIWERPGLSKQDGSLITVAALIATHRPTQLKGHIQRALKNGVTKTEISELVTHLAFYAGWPAAMVGATVAMDAYEDPRRDVRPVWRSRLRRDFQPASTG